MSDAVSSHWFGLPVPEGVTPVRAWGARAILIQRSTRKPVMRRGRVKGYMNEMTTGIETLPDRSQYRGPGIESKESKAFFRWLDLQGMAELRKLADKMGLAPNDDIEVKVDHDNYHIRANPRRSYGYLYIVAWEE